ncbi:morphogenesis protein sog2 [Anaeramoeba flamelloides]|uniref:Morphogenesis protein sog2 n=1 Tax=Anaeramoeba flamelloides TaxID=1746091 RepID=A0ABQ8X687_9EUKA|nr:morphogenesis protein sog2 [Anaeramoeba flamelloides]
MSKLDEHQDISIKIEYSKEHRRFSIKQEIKYIDFCKIIDQLFKSDTVKENKDYLFNYKDDEEELIVFSSDLEFKEAIRYSLENQKGLLKIYLTKVCNIRPIKIFDQKEIKETVILQNKIQLKNKFNEQTCNMHSQTSCFEQKLVQELHNSILALKKDVNELMHKNCVVSWFMGISKKVVEVLIQLAEKGESEIDLFLKTIQDFLDHTKMPKDIQDRIMKIATFVAAKIIYIRSTNSGLPLIPFLKITLTARIFDLFRTENLHKICPLKKRQSEIEKYKLLCQQSLQSLQFKQKPQQLTKKHLLTQSQSQTQTQTQSQSQQLINTKQEYENSLTNVKSHNPNFTCSSKLENIMDFSSCNSAHSSNTNYQSKHYLTNCSTDKIRSCNQMTNKIPNKQDTQSFKEHNSMKQMGLHMGLGKYPFNTIPMYGMIPYLTSPSSPSSSSSSPPVSTQSSLPSSPQKQTTSCTITNQMQKYNTNSTNYQPPQQYTNEIKKINNKNNYEEEIRKIDNAEYTPKQTNLENTDSKNYNDRKTDKNASNGRENTYKANEKRRRCRRRRKNGREYRKHYRDKSRDKSNQRNYSQYNSQKKDYKCKQYNSHNSNHRNQNHNHCHNYNYNHGQSYFRNSCNLNNNNNNNNNNGYESNSMKNKNYYHNNNQQYGNLYNNNNLTYQPIDQVENKNWKEEKTCPIKEKWREFKNWKKNHHAQFKNEIKKKFTNFSTIKENHFQNVQYD